MTRACRPDVTSPRLSEAESRARYLEHINHCKHDGPQLPGWPCGGCGREWDEIENEEEKEVTR